MEVSKFYFFHLNIFIIDELQKLLEDVRFSQKGTTEREKEEATYMFFFWTYYTVMKVCCECSHTQKCNLYAVLFYCSLQMALLPRCSRWRMY